MHVILTNLRTVTVPTKETVKLNSWWAISCIQEVPALILRINYPWLNSPLDLPKLSVQNYPPVGGSEGQPG